MLLRAYASISDFFWSIGMENFPQLPIHTFGFFVALGFISGAIVLRKELFRRKEVGVFEGVKSKEKIGFPPTTRDVIGTVVFGFIFGFKLIGILTQSADFNADQVGYLLSGQGSWIGGIALAALFGYWQYRTLKKKELPEPYVKDVMLYPHNLVGDMVILAAIIGVLGANLFNIIDHGSIDEFLENPVESLFSGLTIYGGLLCAGIAIIYFARKKNINIPHLFDSLAPTYMLAYGIGRLGCHFSGDGDWGVENLADKPAWIPQGFWASHYEHNVIHSGVPIEGCTGEYCTMLANPVWPTSVYEFFMALILFSVLWSLRKKLTAIPGMLIGIFFMMNGAERFLIEKIRVNEKHDVMGMQLTQAEIISFFIFLFGLLLTTFIYMRHKRMNPPKPDQGTT